MTAWSADSAFGRRLIRFGPRIPTTGLTAASPRSHNQRYIDRHADNVRAIDAGDKPARVKLRDVPPNVVCAQRCERSLVGKLDQALQVRSIRGQRVPRCAPLCRKLEQESVDQSARHRRCTRSGAAGAPVPRWPVRRCARETLFPSKSETDQRPPSQAPAFRTFRDARPTRSGSSARLFTTPSGPSHDAASKPTFEPQNGTRMLLAKVIVSLSTACAQSSDAYAGLMLHRRSAANGTSKICFSSSDQG